MIAIDKDLLAQHGINVPAGDEEAFMNEVQDYVQKHVGLAMIGRLNDEDAKHLLEQLETTSVEQLSGWIEQRIPDYESYVQDQVGVALDNFADEKAE